MSKFTDFFIANDNPQPTVEPSAKQNPPVTTFPSQAPTSFPTVTPTPSVSFPTNTPAPTSSPNQFINDILDIYDKGFTKLNQPGYDFFEFFKSISAVGVDNPTAYVMALQMAQVQDSSVTKDTLVPQADYYVTELEKIHESICTDGTKKIQELTDKKTEETKSLTTEISNLQLQLQTISEQLQLKQKSLTEIDGKFQPKLTEISEKLSANDTAKNMIVSNILKVKNNIQINLK